jgi:4-amino-4-deoxy-L-arabinose transferase-like glycosyltransferase
MPAVARSTKLLDLLLGLLVLVLAGGVRYWYLTEKTDDGQAPAGAVWQVQGRSPLLNPTVNKDARPDQEVLIDNLKNKGLVAGYHGPAPFGKAAEPTAMTAPGYAMFRALIESTTTSYGGDNVSTEAAVRTAQGVLGSLTALLYFAFARRAFASRLVGLLAGVLTALHPFWVINTGEMEDGTLATFLVALVLWLGLHGGHQGGALTSLLFGVALAAMVLTRAALLPFALVTLLWFVLRCRTLAMGWLCGLVATAVFITGLSPWVLRNYEQFGEPVPVASSAWWHLWVGNNPKADGGPFTWDMERQLSLDRLEKLGSMSEPHRYSQLATDVADEVQAQPGRTLARRLRAALYFLLGSPQPNRTTMMTPGDGPPPDPWVFDWLTAGLLVMGLFGLLGWRWSYGWRRTSLPLSLAIFWIPLPYILAHAEALHGPRLPLDGPLLCLAALAIGCLIPGVGAPLLRGEKPRVVEEV